jgi:hypothetical protein
MLREIMILDDRESRENTIITPITVAFLLIAIGLGCMRTNVSAEYFSDNIRVDDSGISISAQVGPSIEIDNQGIIHVVWEDWRNDADGKYIIGGGVDGVNNADIYYTNSTNGGLSFDTNRKVNDNVDISSQEFPSISVDSNGKIHVVWTDWRNDADGEGASGGGIDGVNNADIYYANSTDGGITWSPGKMVSDDSGTYTQDISYIAVDKNNKIHVIWIDNRNIPQDDIYYANSTDGGISFSKNRKINDVSKGSNDPALAVDDNNVIYVAWVDERNDTTKSDIYFSRSTDGGISFSLNKKVNDDDLPLTYQGTPSIAVGGGILGVVWQDDRNPYGIYFANSTDEGDTFSVNKEVDDDPTESPKERPSIAIDDNGYMAIAWMDKRNNDYDIYFANSTDGGDTFTQNQRVNDDMGTEYQYFPSLGLRNRTVYIAWQDNRNGNWDIYFARSNIPLLMTMPISPPSDSSLTDNTPALVITPVIDGDGDAVYYNFTISDQPDAESGTSYSSGWITSTSWTTPTLADGKWYWHTYASDMWNTTAPNWVWNFTIDATPPVITNLEPPDSSWTNEKTPTIGADYSDSSGINVSSVMFEIDGSDMTSFAVVTSSGFTYTPQTDLPSGLHTINLEVEDSLGNLAIASWSFTVNDKPIVEVWEPGGVQYQEYVQGDFIMVAWTATDDNPLPSNPINITYGNSTSGWITISLNEENDGLYNWDTSTVPCPGVYWLNLSVYDSFGQTVFDESNYSFNITCLDTTPPVISNLQPPNGSLMNNGYPLIAANFSDTSGVNVSSVLLKVDGEDVTSWASIFANGIEYMPESALSDGLHTIYLEVEDIHGNAANATWTFEVDTQPDKPPDDFLANYWWIILMLVVVIGFLIILFFIWRRRRKSDDEEDSDDAE